MKNPMDEKITHHIMVTNCDIGDNDSLLTVLGRLVLFAISLPVGFIIFFWFMKFFCWCLNNFVLQPK
jgi:hypothetical protein